MRLEIAWENKLSVQKWTSRCWETIFFTAINVQNPDNSSI
jgi:hypothetical protein